jgi:hypothetical protein
MLHTATHSTTVKSSCQLPLVGHLSPVHSSNALIYHAILAKEWPISWQMTH